MQSVQDKLADIEVSGSGKVLSNYILEKKPGQAVDRLNRYSFDSLKDFAEWKERNAVKHQKNLRARLTPHQYYIT